MTNLADGLSEDVLWLLMTSRYDVKAFRKHDQIHLDGAVLSHRPLHEKHRELLLDLVDLDGRLTEYCDGFLEEHISWDMEKNFEVKHYHLDIGSVFMLENLLRDGDGDPYDCEPTQFGLIIDPAPDSTTTASRRLSKSFSHRIPTFRNCIAYPGHGVQVTEQSWTVAKFWLRDVYNWYNNNPLIQQWSGGKLKKDADYNIEFGNRSFIICYTASTLENLSGIGVHELINDEESLYTTDVSRGSITGLGQKTKEGKPAVRYRHAGTPYGMGTSFHHNQINTRLLQNFAPMLCPKGFKKPLCYNCDYYTLTQWRKGKLRQLKLLECTAKMNWNKDGTPNFTGCYKRAPDDRVTYDELMDFFWRLGKTQWLQEFMCRTHDYTGNAIPLDMIRKITEDTWEPVFASMNPCFVGLDYGKSEKHCSAFSVVGEEPGGSLRNYQTFTFPPGTPYNPNPDDNRESVLETVVKLFDTYPNIQMIVADAMGVGATPTEESLPQMCRNKNGFNNVVAYKTVGESKRFLGKSQLWFRLVKPSWESGRFKTYYDERLHAEMRAWQCDFPPTDDSRPKLHPSKIGKTQTDDALMSLLYAQWGALSSHIGQAREKALVSGIPGHHAHGLSVFEQAYQHG